MALIRRVSAKKLTVLYSGSPYTPPWLRVKYLITALTTKGMMIKEINLPKTRLLYLRRPKVRDENVLFSVPPAFVALSFDARRSVADVRDPWDVYVRESGKIKRLLASYVVKRYLKAIGNSDLVVATTKSIAEHYKEVLGKEAIVIPNGSDPETLKCNTNERQKEVIVIANFNNPYLPLGPLVRAAKRLGVKLKLVGPGSEKYGGLGPVKYDELPKVACSSAVGAVPRPFVGTTYKMTIPTKVYDYMSLGLCVFAYGPPNSELEEMIEEHSIGAYASREEEVNDALERCLSEFEEAGRRARRLVEEVYDRRKLSERYAEELLKLFQ